MDRKLQMARRCQLVIGSWEGNPYQCPCKSPDRCPLTPEERQLFLQYSEVQEAQKRSLEGYNNEHIRS